MIEFEFKLWPLLSSVSAAISKRPGPSVTRFGEILPIKQKFRNLWQHFKGLFDIWQSCEPTLGLFVCFWAKFHHCKWPNIEKTIWPSGHTARGLMNVCQCTDHRERGLLKMFKHIFLGSNVDLLAMA